MKSYLLTLVCAYMSLAGGAGRLNAMKSIDSCSIIMGTF